MRRSRKNLIITLTFTFILMTLLVIFTAKVVFRTAFSSVQELGDDKTTAITADLENYLETAKSVLWLTADTVDHMVEKGASIDEIIEYITKESTHTEERFDESYTGIYGVIHGTYVDGVGWVPPADYDPTKRDWYLTTVAGKGDVVIVSPYVDAQTGSVIISVGRALSDNRNALALDLTLDGVQEIVEKIQINGYGYGYIVNQDGMVIAHHDRTENGKNYAEMPEHRELFQKVLETDKGNFDTELNGEKCTVFVDEVMDQWHLVIVTKNSELFKAPTYLLFISILINLVVFLLISVFYLVGYSSERKFSARMEEMKENERKKDYEARVLKLEKSAADSANKAKSDFLADMSHEIRTPINAVLGMNEMILHESKEPSTLEYASNIKSAGTTLLSIINSILDFSKIEEGKMSLVPVEFRTADLITELENSISGRAREKGLEFRVEVDESTPSILLGDDVRISQVIMNLLTNAVKYTEKGYILFSVKNLGITDDKVRLLISVKDTGIGIHKEDINRLAVSFERVDEKKNRHIEGTGLGISIVTNLLTMMGSALKVTSEYGVGSDFSFELPVEVVDDSPVGDYKKAQKAHAGNEDDSVAMRAPRARILLTDDNEMNRKVASNLLKLFRIRPVLCSSGEETIQKMQQNTYDILFLDHMMPEMDGIETLDRLQQSSLIKGTKVIALTANAVVGAREQYMSVGFDDYLSKPISLQDLEKALRKYLPADVIEEVEAVKPAEETPTDNPSRNTADDDTPEKMESPAVDLSENTLESRTKDFSEDILEFPAEDHSEDILEFPAENVDAPLSWEEPSASSEDTASDKKLAECVKMGLDVKRGLTYCGDSKEFYLEILHDYGESAAEKSDQLNRFLKDGNLKDYEVVIHSIKSSSKTIGARELFEKARDLEDAAVKEDLDYIRANHEEFMTAYRELADQLG